MFVLPILEADFSIKQFVDFLRYIFLFILKLLHSFFSLINYFLFLLYILKHKLALNWNGRVTWKYLRILLVEIKNFNKPFLLLCNIIKSFDILTEIIKYQIVFEHGYQVVRLVIHNVTCYFWLVKVFTF